MLENSYMVFLYEGMAELVQDFITIRVGSLWVDVPMGPLQATNSASSLRITAASPTVVAHDQEVNSKLEEGFTPVVSKDTKRRARRAAAKARVMASNKCVTNVRKATSSNAVPPRLSKPKITNSSTQKMVPRCRPTTLGECPVCTKRVPPTKSTPLMVSSSSTPKAKGVMPPLTSPQKLGACSSRPAPSILGAPPAKTATTTALPPPNGGIVLRDQPHRPQPSNKERAVVVEEINHQQPVNKGKVVQSIACHPLKVNHHLQRANFGLKLQSSSLRWSITLAMISPSVSFGDKGSTFPLTT